MSGSPDSSAPQATFPESFSRGGVILVATAGDPSESAVDLRTLCEYGASTDRALFVTTTASARETMERFDHLCAETDQPALGFVETTLAEPSVSAIYDDTPVILTPSSGGLERIVVALAELSNESLPVQGERHLVVRSLTPMLEATSTAQVGTVLERITGLRSGHGFCLFGLDYTAHSEATMSTVREHVDGTLWVTDDDSDALHFDYRQTSGGSSPPSHGVSEE